MKSNYRQKIKSKKMNRKIFRKNSNPHPRNTRTGLLRGGTRL